MEDELDQLGLLIDQSIDAKDIAELDRAIDKCEQLLIAEISTGYHGAVHYFLANAWSGKRLALYVGNDAWNWEQSELEAEILNLRMAISSSVQEDTPKVRVCQILTNLGNALSYVGRSVESVEYWSRALKIR